MVSIPHRFNSHSAFVLSFKQFCRVSIPHRFNSHLTDKLGWIISVKCFNPSQVQFTLVWRLTGTGYKSKFQSLTGSIHTRKQGQQMSMRSSFNPSQVQFTQKDITCLWAEFTWVSIPHRFNSHWGGLIWPPNRDFVSIPHRFNSHSTHSSG